MHVCHVVQVVWASQSCHLHRCFGSWPSFVANASEYSQASMSAKRDEWRADLADLAREGRLTCASKCEKEDKRRHAMVG